jgi:DNA-binding HxlR family transcriptional regulator
MLRDTYCPIAAAAKILQPKWNIHILRAICLYGVSNFNDIRRLIPTVSPTLVSARLKFLVEHGIIERVRDEYSTNSCYVPTDAGMKLRHVLLTLGEWGRDWLDQEASVHAADSGMLLWVLGRKLHTEALPMRDLTIQFCMEEGSRAISTDYWYHIENRQRPELADNSLGRDPDLIVISKKTTLAACFMNYTSYQAEISRNRIILDGAQTLQSTFPVWMASSEIGRSAQERNGLI